MDRYKEKMEGNIRRCTDEVYKQVLIKHLSDTMNIRKELKAVQPK